MTNFSCNANCLPQGGLSYSMYAGVSTSKGYCNYKCSAGVNCPSTNAQLTALKTTFACSSASFIKTFYTFPSTLTDNSCKFII